MRYQVELSATNPAVQAMGRSGRLRHFPARIKDIAGTGIRHTPVPLVRIAQVSQRPVKRKDVVAGPRRILTVASISSTVQRRQGISAMSMLKLVLVTGAQIKSMVAAKAMGPTVRLRAKR